MVIMNIQEFVKSTLDNNALGADGTYLYTNVFNKAECFKMVHGWGKDNTPEKFAQLCKNGRDGNYSFEWLCLYALYINSLKDKYDNKEDK